MTIWKVRPNHKRKSIACFHLFGGGGWVVGGIPPIEVFPRKELAHKEPPLGQNMLDLLSHSL
jgi:hypothetical protein